MKNKLLNMIIDCARDQSNTIHACQNTAGSIENHGGTGGIQAVDGSNLAPH